MATRKELEAKAAELGIENPGDKERFPNVEALQQAIDTHEEQAPAPENEETQTTEQNEEEGVDSTADAMADAQETAQENHETDTVEEDSEVPTGAERDGTAELESEGTSRMDAIRAGQATARANSEKEAAENEA